MHPLFASRSPLPQIAAALRCSLARRFMPTDPAASAGTAAGPLSLARHCTHRCHSRPGMVVTCTAGSAWLTFDGEQRDVVLAAGESLTCDCEKTLGITGLDETVELSGH